MVAELGHAPLREVMQTWLGVDDDEQLDRILEEVTRPSCLTPTCTEFPEFAEFAEIPSA